MHDKSFRKWSLAFKIHTCTQDECGVSWYGKITCQNPATTLCTISSYLLNACTHEVSEPMDLQLVFLGQPHLNHKVTDVVPLVSLELQYLPVLGMVYHCAIARKLLGKEMWEVAGGGGLGGDQSTQMYMIAPSMPQRDINYSQAHSPPLWHLCKSSLQCLISAKCVLPDEACSTSPTCWCPYCYNLRNSGRVRPELGIHNPMHVEL